MLCLCDVSLSFVWLWKWKRNKPDLEQCGEYLDPLILSIENQLKWIIRLRLCLLILRHLSLVIIWAGCGEITTNNSFILCSLCTVTRQVTSDISIRDGIRILGISGVLMGWHKKLSYSVLSLLCQPTLYLALRLPHLTCFSFKFHFIRRRLFAHSTQVSSKFIILIFNYVTLKR